MNVDQTSWDKVRVTGADRVRFLHGMCTANIEKLADGSCIRACILNAKGRLMAVVEVFARGAELVLICEPGQGQRVIDLLSKFAIVDDVTFELIPGPLSRVWNSVADVWTAQPRFEAAAAPVASSEAVEIRRVEAGMPKYGVDISDDHFPFETPLMRHVDDKKGCYIGQEPVARVSSRGSAQKTLRGLLVRGELPAIGATLSHPSRANAGAITSAVVSPSLGTIALAYVHRDAWEPGTEVEVDGQTAEVVALPFVND